MEILLTLHFELILIAEFSKILNKQIADSCIHWKNWAFYIII